MSPGADGNDASPSPEPGIDFESGIMAETKTERASSEEKTPPQSGSESKPTKPNSKDPSRPRRKKARRACFACQRAHLTCGEIVAGVVPASYILAAKAYTDYNVGDERPCLRCVKRGLQDQCHDGVRKKAKYLHDAPADALVPGFPGNYHINGGVPALSGAPLPEMGPPTVTQQAYFASNAPTTYPQYNQPAQTGSMPPPPHMDSNTLLNDFTSQSSVSGQHTSPAQDVANPMDAGGVLDNTGPSNFDFSLLDANDPSLYNFNLSEMNFDNHYGALEFGMLGHMSGAVASPMKDVLNMSQDTLSYDGSTGFQNTYGFNPTMSSWQSVPYTGSRQNSASNAWLSQGNGPDAYAIGEHGSISHSPRSQQGYNSSPDVQYAQPDQSSQRELLRQSVSQSQTNQQRRQGVFPGNSEQLSRKRRRDTAAIYSAVQAPYSYTQGFHALTAFLQKRFPSKKVLRIAKALATIRPSFISCNQNLNHDDLIFMEKCFQRTLCEYEDFLNHYGTPTIICRRTGEIAAVSKEFSIITGWNRDVLLGKAPNLNVNTGSMQSGTQTGTSSRGAATPRISHVEIDPGRPQPVFLAELMDEDSVVNFYEDFAELAFGASNTSIIGSPCSLIKYKTKEARGWGVGEDEGTRQSKQSADPSLRDALVKGQDVVKELGEQEGRVACSMCWTVKRDVFDIPMLIVMNVSPLCFLHFLFSTDASAVLADYWLNPKSSVVTPPTLRGRILEGTCIEQ